MTEQLTFEQYVNQWLEIKRQAAALKAQEMTMRKAIAASVRAHCGETFKEGANTMEMADGRKITITHKITRNIEQGEIANVRNLYLELNDRPVDFDDLLKVKYELAVAPFRKLSGQAATVVSRMVTAKEGSPEVTVK